MYHLYRPTRQQAHSIMGNLSRQNLEYNPVLGDAFALAAAEELEATLLVSGDSDYDEIIDVLVERFREEFA